jgi:stringent starvation protein B
MTSNRPYLIRALYEWIENNGFTPYLLVNAEFPGVEIPKQYVQDGHILLNINAVAVRDLHLGNDWIEFNARFSGIARTICVPVAAVLAIYARENGQGMAFSDEKCSGGDDPPPHSPSTASSTHTNNNKNTTNRPDGRPKLKIVK